MKERWRPIVGYEGHYEVSDLGRVRSIKAGKKRLMKFQPVGYGYLTVMLSKPGSNHPRKRPTVHRVVLEAFVGPRPPGMQARHHPDPTLTNCRLSNLSWGTPQQNWEDRNALGRHPRGAVHPLAKFTPAQVKAIRRRKGAGERNAALAKEFGVHPYTIGRIAKNVTYRDTRPHPDQSQSLAGE